MFQNAEVHGWLETYVQNNKKKNEYVYIKLLFDYIYTSIIEVCHEFEFKCVFVDGVEFGNKSVKILI